MKAMERLLISVLFVLFCCTAMVSAAGTGILSVTDVEDVPISENGTVTFSIDTQFNPYINALGYKVYYDKDIIDMVGYEAQTPYAFTGDPDKLPSMLFSFLVTTGKGYPEGIVDIYNVTFMSKWNDGRSTEIGIVVDEAYDTVFPIPNDLSGDITVINGTFTTKDEVSAQVVNITTPATVGHQFDVTGYIYEVGGMAVEGAWARLDPPAGGTPMSYILALTAEGDGYYSYKYPALDYPETVDGVTLTVYAQDAAGNPQTSLSKVINVKDIGFSDPSPEGYIKALPGNASVFMQQINTTTVSMTLSNLTWSTPLGLTFNEGYAFGALPALDDGLYTVNVTGKDSLAGDDQSKEWTFTLDTTVPTLSLAIADSDGDGYIEANENLTFNWVVTTPGASGFKDVEIVNTATEDVLWSSNNQADIEDLVSYDGNIDCSFRAYDNAGNYAAHDFHIYNNYVAWVNSTKIGTVSGLNTEFTAMVDMDETTTSMVELIGGRDVAVPDIGTITRHVENVGQVTSDTYVAVDNRANATYDGTDTYQTLWVYDPTDIIDFRITAPDIDRANVVMMEANESYLNELIDSGSSSNINYTQLVKTSAYIFIEGGWTKITVNPDGSYTQDVRRGTQLTTSGNITETLKNRANQVDLSSGYRLSTDSVAFDATTTPPVGDYALAALAFDADRIGVIAMMPVVILETADEGAISVDTVVENGTFDASVSSNCKYFGVALYRDTEYNASVLVDFSNLNYDMVTVDLSAGGAATERLWHNIYITPGAGKYAEVKDANSLTFDVSGLDPGNYKAVLAGMSPTNGTAQALGIHDLTITPATSLNISNVVVATGTTAAYVTWDTNIAANSTVEYGTTVAYGANVSSADLVTAHALSISGLSPATTYHYRITSYDAAGNMAVTADAVFTTRSSGGGGGGGGGGGFVAPTTPVQEFTTTGTLQTDSTGAVQSSVIIYAADKLSSVYIGEGVQALQANGQPVVDITIQETQNVPSPGVSTFVFAGHAVKVGPAGATFSPAIELTFQLTEEEWNALKPGESFTIKWFNDGTGEWEDIPTTVNPYTHTVIGEITHFSTFAVFKQVVEEPTTVVTETPTVSPGETPVATATPVEPVTDGGFPWVWVIVVIVLIAVIGGGYYYMQQKND